MMRAYIALLVLAFSAVAFAGQAVLGGPDVTITHVVPDPDLGSATMVITLPAHELYALSATPGGDRIATATSPPKASNILPTPTDEGEFVIYDNAAVDVIADRTIAFLIGSAIAAGIVYQMI
jgi:hypothetical protein